MAAALEGNVLVINRIFPITSLKYCVSLLFGCFLVFQFPLVGGEECCTHHLERRSAPQVLLSPTRRIRAQGVSLWPAGDWGAARGGGVIAIAIFRAICPAGAVVSEVGADVPAERLASHQSSAGKVAPSTSASPPVYLLLLLLIPPSSYLLILSSPVPIFTFQYC